MAFTLDLFDLEKEINAVIDSLKTFSTTFAAQRDLYSDTGARKAWQTATRPHAERLEELREFVNMIAPYAEKVVADARGEQYPTPQNAEETVAAELTAARWLARGLDVEMVMNVAANEAPAPWRTLVLEEARARKVVEPHRLDALVAGGSGDLQAALGEQKACQQAIGSLNGRIRIAEALIASPNADTDAAHLVPLSSIFSDATIQAPRLLHRWTPPSRPMFHSETGAVLNPDAA